MVDRACGFNRRYCSEACGAVGRAASVGKAQKTYRDKPAVRERHCKEESARRARLAERVRDHIQKAASGCVTVESMVAPKIVVAAGAVPAAALVRSAPGAARRSSALAPPAAVAPCAVARTTVVAPAASAPTPAAAPPGHRALAQWRLIVGHALAAHAERLRRRGSVVHCACCGRPGRVVAVVVRAELEWRRQPDEDEG